MPDQHSRHVAPQSSLPVRPAQVRPAPAVLDTHATAAPYPFSDPGHSDTDLQDLRAMQVQVLQVLAGQPGPAQQLDRIYDAAALRTLTALTVVGFRGIGRADVPATLLEEVSEVDAALSAQLQADAGGTILSYSTRQIGAHDWLNLVLMRSDAGLRYWHDSALHRHAAQQLSPHLYHGIRLHTGALPQGLSGPLHLRATKYYAFGETHWHGQRAYAPAP